MAPHYWLRDFITDDSGMGPWSFDYGIRSCPSYNLEEGFRIPDLTCSRWSSIPRSLPSILSRCLKDVRVSLYSSLFTSLSGQRFQGSGREDGRKDELNGRLQIKKHGTGVSLPQWSYPRLFIPARSNVILSSDGVPSSFFRPTSGNPTLFLCHPKRVVSRLRCWLGSTAITKTTSTKS